MQSVRERGAAVESVMIEEERPLVDTRVSDAVLCFQGSRRHWWSQRTEAPSGSVEDTRESVRPQCSRSVWMYLFTWLPFSSSLIKKKRSLCKTLLYLMDSFLFLIMDTTCPATRDLCCYVFLCPLRLILFYWCFSLFVVLFSISHEAVVSRAGGASHPNGLLQAVCQ